MPCRPPPAPPGVDLLAPAPPEDAPEPPSTDLLTGGSDEEGAEFDDEGGIDLKAVSRRAAQVAEKRVIERVLHQTRWNRKQAAGRLKISYKALLYKMKENGLSEGR